MNTRRNGFQTPVTPPNTPQVIPGLEEEEEQQSSRPQSTANSSNTNKNINTNTNTDAKLNKDWKSDLSRSPLDGPPPINTQDYENLRREATRNWIEGYSETAEDW